ncbi:hypothetical protein GGR44_002729 [Sphingobium fontiphilum]|uniref:Lipoprotein n=1 Tax=Sphingobium fontiphilum TaxID=944425 RepID=A0A7W6DI69_9SPHN|nr:hypothetical protein [Sphingobium fontiphilum]MBB3983049.1 hypothetical protein [Sphingobium fontiphilum]
MIHWKHSVLAMAAALMLPGCLVTPGQFESSLDIRADRSFTFAYKGEILAANMNKGSISPLEGGGAPAKEDSAYSQIALWQAEGRAEGTGKDNRPDGAREDVAQLNAMAAALAKEPGFRSARYVGNKTLVVDYRLSGTLTHAFLFPFNIDAQVPLPFLAVELRGADTVRVKAPAFANQSGKAGDAAMLAGNSDESAKALNGHFVLTTDAEIISQNQEDGAQPGASGKQIRWTITPLTSEAPMAVLRLKPL